MHQTQTLELTQNYDETVMRLKDRIIALEVSKSSSPSNASDSVTPTNADAGRFHCEMLRVAAIRV